MANSFAADISKWVQKTGIKADIVLKKIVFDAFAGVILRSPVDTGRFRASWRVSVNSVNDTVEPDRAGVPSPLKGQGGSAPADPGEQQVAQIAISTAKFGDIVYITNNLPYGPALEGGWSKQAPSGVMAITFLEIVTNLQNAIASVP